VVNRVAEIAENDDHHPDIDIRWRTLTFRVSTHSKGGVTALDISLASEIDGVVEALG
jgi:4a-hydroxytetrahydrobiopterin dehydratase